MTLAAGSLLGGDGFGCAGRVAVVGGQLPLLGEELADGLGLGGQSVVLTACQEPVFHHGPAVLVGPGADPYAAAVDVQRDDESCHGQEREDQGGDLAGVVVDVHTDVPLHAVERDAALAVRKGVGAARCQGDATGGQVAIVQRGEALDVQFEDVLRCTVI